MNTTLLFVYGTLLKGQHNHKHLKSSTLLGEGQTVNNYILYIADGLLPKVVSKPSYPIKGELYMVNEADMIPIDIFEANYSRQKVDIIVGDVIFKNAYMYVYPEISDTIRNIPHTNGDYIDYLIQEYGEA